MALREQVWRIDATALEQPSTHSRNPSHSSSTLTKSIYSDRQGLTFASTIRELAGGRMNEISKKLKDSSIPTKKFYWQDPQYNPSITNPSTFNSACNAADANHRMNWSKGFRFSTSRRTYQHNPSIDIYPREIDEDHMIHNTEKHREDITKYSNENEVEVFERRRELHPFTRVTTSSMKKRNQSKPLNTTESQYMTSYNRREDNELGPGSYDLPDLWAKTTKTTVCGFRRGSHQFMSKTTRLSPSTVIKQKPLPTSQSDIEVHPSSLKGSRKYTASISELSYLPIRPTTVAASNNLHSTNKSKSKVSVEDDQLSSSMMSSTNDSATFDRFNLESLAPSDPDNCDITSDYIKLFQAGPVITDNDNDSKSLGSTNNFSYREGDISYYSSTSLPRVQYSIPQTSTSLELSLQGKNAQTIRAMSAQRSTRSDDIYGIAMSPLDVPSENYPRGCYLPGKEQYSQVDTWSGPKFKSKTRRSLLSSEKRNRQSHSYEVSTENRPKTSISSAFVADILPLKDSASKINGFVPLSYHSLPITRPFSSSNILRSTQSYSPVYDTLGGVEFKRDLDIAFLTKTSSAILDGDSIDTTVCENSDNSTTDNVQ